VTPPPAPPEPDGPEPAPPGGPERPPDDAEPSLARRAIALLAVPLQAAVFIVATVVVFIEEARTPGWALAFQLLWYPLLAKWAYDAWRDWRRGDLSIPLSQLHRRIAEGKARRSSLLEVAAVVMGVVAASKLATA
jgi:hypothetical protein